MEDVRVFIKLVQLSFRSIKDTFKTEPKKEEGKVMLLISHTADNTYI